MQLDKRQKILVGILGGTLVLFWGVPIVWEIIFGPFTSRYATIAALNEKLSQKEGEQTRLEMAEWRLADANRRSLPSDPSSLAYQVWLTELATKQQFTGLGVAPKSSSRNGNEPFSRIRFTVTAHCKMKDLCQFLFDFYSADLLHKVTNLSVKSIDATADPELDVAIDIEGLSMQTTKKRDTLFEGKQATSVATDMRKKSFSDYDLLHAKNRFARGYEGPPKPTIPPAPPTPPFDSAPYVKFVGFVELDGVGEAWLYDQTSNKNTVLRPGLEFEIAGVKASVVNVSKDFITLRVKEKTWRIEQGESLKQMREVGTDGQPLTAPTKTTEPAVPVGPASSVTAVPGPMPTGTISPTKTETKPNPVPSGSPETSSNPTP